MLKKEELESWNIIFTNCNINEKDLANPTEQFLTKVLCAYLRKLGYKVEFLDMGNEATTEKRLFLIKLVHQIDHILKITHKSYAFTYYDLISPTKKKTSTMLRILLNYLHYYEMYKMETLPKATERITTWQKLQESIKKIQHEIKQNEIDAMKIKEDVKQLNSQVVQLKEEVDNQRAAKIHSEKELNEIKKRQKHLEEKLTSLNAQRHNLKQQIVPNQEVHELQERNKKYKKNYEETQQQITTNEQQIRETNDLMRKIQDTVQQLNKAKDTIRPKILTEIVENTKELQTKNLEFSKTEKKKLDLLEQIKQNLNKKNIYDEKLTTKVEQFHESILKETANIEQCKKELVIQNKYLSNAEEQEKILDAKIEEQNEISEFLENNIKQLNFYEN